MSYVCVFLILFFYIKYITIIIDVETHHNNEDNWAGKAPYDAVLNTEPAVALG